MKFKDYFLHFFPAVFNGMLVILIAIGIIVSKRWNLFFPFGIVLVPLYIAELIVTIGYFKKRM